MTMWSRREKVTMTSIFGPALSLCTVKRIFDYRQISWEVSVDRR
jgi:hypothetical protein